MDMELSSKDTICPFTILSMLLYLIFIKAWRFRFRHHPSARSITMLFLSYDSVWYIRSHKIKTTKQSIDSSTCMCMYFIILLSYFIIKYVIQLITSEWVHITQWGNVDLIITVCMYCLSMWVAVNAISIQFNGYVSKTTFHTSYHVNGHVVIYRDSNFEIKYHFYCADI